MFDSVVAKLKQRFIGELPFWRLNVWQFLLLLLLAIWPWLSMWVIPNNKWLAFVPVIVFMPFAYVGGAMLTQALPKSMAEFSYAAGVSLTIFFLAYLVLIIWRQRRGKKQP